jgi:hypothetical protein
LAKQVARIPLWTKEKTLSQGWHLKWTYTLFGTSAATLLFKYRKMKFKSTVQLAQQGRTKVVHSG